MVGGESLDAYFLRKAQLQCGRPDAWQVGLWSCRSDGINAGCSCPWAADMLSPTTASPLPLYLLPSLLCERPKWPGQPTGGPGKHPQPMGQDQFSVKDEGKMAPKDLLYFSLRPLSKEVFPWTSRSNYAAGPGQVELCFRMGSSSRMGSTWQQPSYRFWEVQADGICGELEAAGCLPQPLKSTMWNIVKNKKWFKCRPLCTSGNLW